MSKKRMIVVGSCFAAAVVAFVLAGFLASPASAAGGSAASTGTYVYTGDNDCDSHDDGITPDHRGKCSPTPTPTHTKPTMSPTPSRTPSKPPTATPTHTKSATPTPSQTTPTAAPTTTTPAPIHTTAGPPAVTGADSALQTVRSPWFWVLMGLAVVVLAFIGRRKLLRYRRNGTAQS